VVDRDDAFRPRFVRSDILLSDAGFQLHEYNGTISIGGG